MKLQPVGAGVSPHAGVFHHTRGYVSLMSNHDTYLVTSPSGQLVAWHRGHREADDWEKFKLIYNSDAGRQSTWIGLDMGLGYGVG